MSNSMPVMAGKNQAPRPFRPSEFCCPSCAQRKLAWARVPTLTTSWRSVTKVDCLNCGGSFTRDEVRAAV